MTLPRQSNSERIRDALEQRIVDGTLPPGTRLLELSIAKEFQTSQTPVREALEALQTMGLVESKRYRGTYVRVITDREMEEAYAVRGALEQLAAELAAPRLQGNVTELKAILDQLQLAADAGDAQAYAEHNHEFHRTIVECSGNALLLEAWNNLGFETRVKIHLSEHKHPNLNSRADEHTPVLEALALGDGHAAGEALKKHSEACCQRWKQRHRPEDEPDFRILDAPSVSAAVLS